MKTEPKTKFTKVIVTNALSLLPALTDSLPVFILYLFTVLWYTVLNRAETYEIFQPEFFWSFRKFLAGDARLGIEIAGNVIMFMPFGFLLCGLFYKWQPARITNPSAFSSSASASTVQVKREPESSRKIERYGKWILIPLLALSFSLLIETLQLTLVRGLAEADDLFTNTFGAILGLCSYEVLQKLNNARTFKAVLAIIRAAFVLVCLIILIFDRKLYPFKEHNLALSFCFQVDEASAQGNELTLSGFAFGYNRRQITPRLVLRQTKTGDQIYLNVNYGAARPDVNEYFLCDYDYTNVGFTATGFVNPKTEYEILIGWPLAKPVSTGVYILGEDVHRVAYEETYDEELIKANKEKDRNGTGGDESLNGTAERERPGNTDEDEIIFGTTSKENLAGTGRFELPDLPTDYVKNGTLLVYRPDMHIWIFQYDDYLYWVADEGFHFEDDGMTYIQYHLWTTQLEKLPPARLKANHFWNNLSGYFEKFEISGEFGKYRVMRCELPTEHSITSILTGYCKDGEWVWANGFRPVYD